jgi:hypothetical protein
MAKTDGLLLCDDLIFASKITATARAHGLNVKVAKTLTAFLADATTAPGTGVVLDLHHSAFDISEVLANIGPRSVTAYGSHVDVERLKAARAAGCTRVLPRSAFVEKLENELTVWLSTLPMLDQAKSVRPEQGPQPVDVLTPAVAIEAKTLATAILG